MRVEVELFPNGDSDDRIEQLLRTILRLMIAMAREKGVNVEIVD